MTIKKSSLSAAASLVVCAAAFLGPKPLVGQEYMGDFMFHPPKVTVSMSFGFAVPSASSDIFQEITDDYTLEKGDFHAPAIGGGVSFFLNDRMDLALEFSWARSSTWSEYTDYVDFDDLPIEQETQFTQVPVTASLRYFLMDRGRAIGNLSWIPTTWAPYVGVGGGGMYYEFQQSGDFIDFSDQDWPIVQSMVESQGWSWVVNAFGGLQWALSPHLVATAEARYSLANAELDRPAYQGYEAIDLSGFQGSLGFGVRF